jgi:hypothetical protein
MGESGRWTDEGTSGTVPAAVRRPSDENRPGDPDRFFDTIYPSIHSLATRLGTDETWLLGLAAHESWYLNAHNRAINNPFGVTHGGGSNVHYSSINAALAYWEQRYGSAVRGATSAQDFVSQLYRENYNTLDPDWQQKVLGVIRSIPRRLSAWRSRRGI